MGSPCNIVICIRSNDYSEKRDEYADAIEKGFNAFSKYMSEQWSYDYEDDIKELIDSVDLDDEDWTLEDDFSGVFDDPDDQWECISMMAKAINDAIHPENVEIEGRNSCTMDFIEDMMEIRIENGKICGRRISIDSDTELEIDNVEEMDIEETLELLIRDIDYSPL